MASASYSDFQETLAQGTDRRLTFTVLDGNGQPVDISGWSLSLTGRPGKPTGDVLFTLSTGAGSIQKVDGGVAGGGTCVLTRDLFSPQVPPVVIYLFLTGTDSGGIVHEISAGRLTLKDAP